MRSITFTLTFFFFGSLLVLGALGLFGLSEYVRVGKSVDRAMVFKPHPYVAYAQLPPALIKIFNEVEYPQSAMCNEWSGLEKTFSDTPSLHPDCNLTWELIKILMPTATQGSFIKEYEDHMTFFRLHVKYGYNEILEQVINRFPFGKVEDRELNGFQNASVYYFKKSLNELSLEQLAGLVVISRNPAYFYPFEDNKMYLRNRTFLLNLIRPSGTPAY
ncbi:transglycosylase domain-containing protein [Bdellovibrio sp. SKB1291214]|uniref:transglycosylase domain-containing protein n=1 Tax=Bdellovibrio sp. SKB1291214 TaxID=1732569 RepID=UPI002240C4CC|nr:transglycosylase domain-containing protein [Bdellovibrio sp. SKB1291214]UYL08370.1 transglycosylase domain-containing protein [Bdellovibrio sp. SKB1291214]